MAEGVVSPLIDKLISLLSREATLLQDIHEEVADIKDELESVQSFLKDADARAAAEDISEGVKTWVKQHFLENNSKGHKGIRKFAQKAMGTIDVRVDVNC
ncbi:hypothetical protein ACJW31_11G180800 [Castanea mollissima]